MRYWARAKRLRTAIGSTRMPSLAGLPNCRPPPIPETSMRIWPETILAPLLIAAMTATGFALTLYIFYPGIMTFDALYIYKDMAKGFFGDWQSPAMIVLWSLIDPIAPGTGSILLLTVTIYWLAFAVIALTVAQRSSRLALLVPLLALWPPAFILVGILWR